MNIRHLTGRTDPVAPIRPQEQLQKQLPVNRDGQSFAEILQKVSGDSKQLQFSGHAIKRLEDRNINLNESDLLRIQEAVDRAELKGSRESLILDGENAFVVNIENRTVITAVDQMELRERVFTQIDSAVITNR